MNWIQKSLSTKITLIICLVLLFVFVAFTAIIALSTSKSLVNAEEEKLGLLAAENARIAKSLMEETLTKQSVIIAAVKNLEAIPISRMSVMLSGLLTSVKTEDKELLSLYYVGEGGNEYQSGFTVYVDASGTKSEPRQDVVFNKREYDAMASVRSLTILEPHQKVINEKEYLVISILQPVFDHQNQFLGLVGADIDVERLNLARYNNGGYNSFVNIIICGHQTVIVDTSNKTAVGSKFMEVSKSKNPGLIIGASQEAVSKTFVDMFKDGTKVYRACEPFYIGDSKMVWLSTTSVEKREVMAPVVRTIFLVIVVCALALVALATISLFVLKKSLRPLNEIEAVAKEMANGNFCTKIEFTEKNEIGRLADSMRNTISALSESFFQINESSNQVSCGAGQVAIGAQRLAMGAAEQATSIEELSTSVGEISVQVTKNAASAKNAYELTMQAEEKLKTGTKEMEAMLAAMTEISDKSSQINMIIQTIEDIAFQTNILALNAAVEAARAGQAGRGFAVVADEVRNLATKSAEAAKTTSQLIADSELAVKKGDQIAINTANTLSEVANLSKQASALVTEIARDCEIETSSINQISLGVNQISAVIQTNSATSQESAVTSEELSNQAQALTQLIARFRFEKYQYTESQRHTIKPFPANKTIPLKEEVKSTKKGNSILLYDDNDAKY